MSRFPEIWLSDLLEVKQRLGIRDEATLRHVVEVLDIRLAGEVAERKKDSEDAPDTTPGPGLGEFPLEGLEAPSPPEHVLASQPPELQPIRTIPRVGEAEWRDVDPLDPVESRHAGSRPPHVPLFDPIEADPILGAVVATPGPGNEIDVERVVSMIAKGRPLLEIPYRVRPSLFRGVRVLADLGPAMQPFRRDQDQMVERLFLLVGAGNVQVQWYEDTPLRRCGSGPVSSWQPFEPPHPGTPVLVLGDLGIGGHCGNVESDWLELADLLAHRESRLTALVPYEDSRWPAPLTAAIDMVVWDRTTNISDVTFRVRR